MAWKDRLSGEFPGRWILFWLLIPNIWIIMMWPVGGPPMKPALVVFGAVALVISQLPWRAVRTIGIAALTIFMATVYIAKLFFIPALNYPMIVQFVSDVRPLRSPEYLIAGIILLIVIGIAMYRAPKVPRFHSPMQYLVAMLAVAVFVNVDAAVTADATEIYKTLPDDQEFDSAVRQVKLGASVDGSHHVLVVMVEAMGLPTGKQEKAIFDTDWDRPEWREKYKVTHGASLYHGTTTYGELRELCGEWAYYSDFDFDGADCLPKRMKQAGYETSAWHNFNGKLFDRLDWYPRIGFDNMRFNDDLQQTGVDQCGGVFPGACDKDVPALIGDYLTRAKTPQFLYWLTLNSHIPIVPEKILGTDVCTLGTEQWRADFPMLCRLFQTHRVIAQNVTEMAMAPDFPPTDILIIGDHRPPLFDRGSLAKFDPVHVPWIYLQARPPAETGK